VTKAPSLEGRLVRRLVAAYAMLAVTTAAALLASLWTAGLLHDETGNAVTRAVAPALTRDAAGGLVLRPTPELQRLVEEDRSVWLVARDARGATVSLGAPPPSAKALVEHLGALSTFGRIGFWIRCSDSTPAAKFVTLQSPVGEMGMLVGVGRRLSVPELVSKTTNIVFVYVLPVALIAGLASIPVILMVVRGTLAPLKDIVEQAQAIRPGQKRARLSGGAAPREVAPLIAAFNAALDRLNLGYERQSRFLADTAHELRTPIAILQARLDGLPADPVNAGLRRDVTRLAGLAEQLLEMQRLDTVGVRRDPVELRSTARDLVCDLAPVVVASGKTISLEAPCAVWTIGDVGAIERAIANLVRNALEHGGTAIVVRITQTGVEVEDDGAGLSLVERDDMFAAFRRNGGSGAGLGLALVRQVAQLHGGQASAHERPGGGLRMRLDFPVSAEDVSPLQSTVS
jgi:signal transduction histidine kinase